jgi:hypothetical protein
MSISYKPKQITIGGHKYKVVYQKNLEDFGNVDVDKKIITLRDNLSTKETLDTLLHEAFHACLALSGLSYLLDDDNLRLYIIKGGYRGVQKNHYLYSN